jgi:hypothetical protein
MGILGWAAVLMIVFWGIGFFLKLGAAVLNIILILAIAMFVLNFIFRGRGKGTSGRV